MFSEQRELQALNIKNCVSFVYHELGLEPEDLYVEPPTYSQLLRKFERVFDINSAIAVAAIVPSNWSGPKVAHIALLSDDKKTVLHRIGPGVNIPVNPEEINKAMESYLENPEAELVYLTLKPKKKWRIF